MPDAYLARIEALLERIADTLDGFRGFEPTRTVDLTPPSVLDVDGTLLPTTATGLAPEPDPLDESDHRVRHWQGGHLERHGLEHWHERATGCVGPGCIGDTRGSDRDWFSLAAWSSFGAVTFCDCPEVDQ